MEKLLAGGAPYMAQLQRLKVLRTVEFEKWLRTLTAKNMLLIEARVFRLEEQGHFGDSKNLKDRLWELRWKSGLRVYYTHLEYDLVLLLIGGNKNGQKNDIKKARALIKSYIEN